MKIAFMSDIHSNLHALQAVLARLKDVGVDVIYCLGDIVGYGPHPKECLDLTRRAAGVIIMGNHDYAIANADFARFNPVARIGGEHSRANLDDSDLEFLRDLPLSRDVHVGDSHLMLYHGSPENPLWDYVFPSQATEILASISQSEPEPEPRIVALGHTHVPLLTRTQPKLGRAPIIVLNPGSVGQPRDGDSRASCAIFDTESLAVVFERVAYDIDAVAAAVRASSLPTAIGDRLFQGR